MTAQIILFQELLKHLNHELDLPFLITVLYIYCVRYIKFYWLFRFLFVENFNFEIF